MTRWFTHNWWQKLVALGIAILAWYIISVNDTSITQRSLNVPVALEGLSESQTQTGAPVMVNVVVSGESVAVNRLRPENFTATLNLSNVSGDYQQRIVVVPPQGINLISVSPETAIGTVEAISSKTVPVVVALTGVSDADELFLPTSLVQTVTARGRESILAQVANATALVTSATGETSVTLFASDSNGQPVPEITLEPPATTVTVSSLPILHSKEVPLLVEQPETSPLELSNFSLSQNTVTVVGPKAALETLEQLTGSVDVSGQDLAVGDYTLPVTLQLPEGVRGLEPITAQFTLTAVNPLSRSPGNTEEPQ